MSILTRDNANKRYNSTFSRRMNITPEKSIQVDSIDDELRNRIWNVLSKYYFGDHGFDSLGGQKIISDVIYDGFFKRQTQDRYHPDDLRNMFFNLKWNEVYDFLEFTLENIEHSNTRELQEYLNLIRNQHIMISQSANVDNIQNQLNHVLEEESAGYRIINGMVTPLTNKGEISEIILAQQTGRQEINTHIESSLKLLSDRKKPDPRNSIKEAISALEALLRGIVGNHDTTLGWALREIQKKNFQPIDQNVAAAIESLYKFSNDSSGVRHASAVDKTKVDTDDARFMLVTCSAIINYLTAKYKHI